MTKPVIKAGMCQDINHHLPGIQDSNSNGKVMGKDLHEYCCIGCCVPNINIKYLVADKETQYRRINLTI